MQVVPVDIKDIQSAHKSDVDECNKRTYVNVRNTAGSGSSSVFDYPYTNRRLAYVRPRVISTQNI